MATQTIMLRTYIENFTILKADKETGIPYPLEKKVEIGRKHLFDFDYPFFDEAYKPVFEKNFIEYFYMREIGYETFGLFKLKLRNWLWLNMPYYNKIWESTLIEYDPLINSMIDHVANTKKDREQIDSVTGKIISDSTSNTVGNSVTNGNQNENRSLDRSDSGNQTLEKENNDFNRELKSNNPDSRLQLTSNSDGSGTIEYASEITENKGSGEENQTQTNSNSRNETVDSSTQINDENNTSSESAGNQKQNSENDLNSNINDIEDYVYHRVGKIGVQTYSKMIIEFRESIINIEKMVFEDMQELFLLYYSM